VKVGGCRVEKPRWLSLVLRAVGLSGAGETGERRGERSGGAMATGEARLSFRDGRVADDWEVVEMLRESLGLTALEASMLTDGVW